MYVCVSQRRKSSEWSHLLPLHSATNPKSHGQQSLCVRFRVRCQIDPKRVTGFFLSRNFSVADSVSQAVDEVLILEETISHWAFT